MQSVCSQREPEPVTMQQNYPAQLYQLRIVMMLDQNSPTACIERRPVVFTVPLERRPKKPWGLLHEIQPRTALSKPMRRPLRYLNVSHGGQDGWSYFSS
jgi:hypothetical protein